jgi:hypothetical protein
MREMKLICLSIYACIPPFVARRLVDKMKPRQPDGLNMGQVDCIAQGDLCIRLDVDYYPQMKLYEDGKFIESYSSVLLPYIFL